MTSLDSLDVHQITQPVTSISDIFGPATPISPIIRDEFKDILFVVLVQVIQFIIATFGIFSNVINVNVYAKMGYSETSSITLTAPAVVDIIAEAWLLIVSVGYRSTYNGTGIPPLSVTLTHVASIFSNAAG
ncbi:hypothetical protein PoB_002963700 [Plakobranchus ocellatus]|uniref:G-protein coupled receptors family 1 profile domain-containing protein n=1 Tax=Plakobranchus ocellatus TaxID=259542 RepID=A0AAV4A8D1_9GAST|nr:hypothetical protein PoB_002963700 [Plakobranchus ocellatus]